MKKIPLWGWIAGGVVFAIFILPGLGNLLMGRGWSYNRNLPNGGIAGNGQVFNPPGSVSLSVAPSNVDMLGTDGNPAS